MPSKYVITKLKCIKPFFCIKYLWKICFDIQIGFFLKIILMEIIFNPVRQDSNAYCAVTETFEEGNEHNYKMNYMYLHNSLCLVFVRDYQKTNMDVYVE